MTLQANLDLHYGIDVSSPVMPLSARAVRDQDSSTHRLQIGHRPDARRAVPRGRVHRGNTMKAVLIVGVLLAGMSSASADGSCTSNAMDKKLAGAAKTSFMTKCQKDAASTCDATAGTKKLYGAAKTSFTTKCVKDAIGG